MAKFFAPADRVSGSRLSDGQVPGMAPERRANARARAQTENDHAPPLRAREASFSDSLPIRLGICAMAKKATSKPMQEILKRITRFGDVEVVNFPEEVILQAPVEEWPQCDCLISFFSEGFPLDKAEAYAALRQPHLVNDLTAQRILLDRRRVYALLEENGIPHPQAVVVERDPETKALLGEAAEHFEEGDDFIQVGSTKIAKPFVEKPVSAEDHNVCIYYPSSTGGGVKNLFRKVGNRSSAFDPECGSVRSDGSYMYEPFMKTQGTDIKVYTVGPEYAHAEARKSPVIDGVVNRNEDGKEVRFPVVLTPKEKEMARRVCLAFGQTVCGFDLLRTTNGSYVIDVNGWSFVKGIPKYYEDAAALLRAHVLTAKGSLRRVESLLAFNCVEADSIHENEFDNGEQAKWSTARSDRWEHEELLAVLAVMRHGDRTPKNKMKLNTTRREFIDLHKRWATNPRKEVKLKAPRQLQAVLDLTYSVLGPDGEPEGGSSPTRDASEAGDAQPKAKEKEGAAAEAGADSSEPLDEKTAEACRLIRAVLAGGHFDGIYRKVQVKPTAWTTSDTGEEEVSAVMVVLKYGGILTPVGAKQAEELGHVFRGEMYPGETHDANEGAFATGLLRLHATQRHDFKVYSSDEGRVQMSAAAFARGLLDLEGGSLTPICNALVETDSLMLDDLPSAALPLIEEAKEHLYGEITRAKAEPAAPQPPGDDADPASPASASGSRSPAAPEPPTGSTGSASSAASSAASGWFGKQQEGRMLSSPWKAAEEALNGVVDSMDFEGYDVEAVPAMLDSFKQLQESMAQLCKEMEVLDPANCSDVTKPLLAQQRWLKLNGELWDKKHNCWNVSKITEIRDAVRFDLIHHPKLVPSLVTVWRIVREINDVIVPREYGCDPRRCVQLGSVVCGKLLRKLLVDLSNSMTLEQQQEELPSWKLTTAVQFLKRMVGLDNKNSSLQRKQSAPAVTPDSEADEECKEAEFAGLDTRLAGPMKSPHRRVRTRLYFTSESHIQTLMNVLRYCHLAKEAGPRRTSLASMDETKELTEVPEDPCNADGVSDRIVCQAVEKGLTANPIFDYLTQIVFRLYEDKRAPAGCPERFRVEVLFSPGAARDPAVDAAGLPQLEKLEPLHAPGRPLTYARLQELLSPFSSSSGGAKQGGVTPKSSEASRRSVLA